MNNIESCIQLRSGRYFDYLDPRPECFTIEDIGHALSKICRFGGHVYWFYSVAEHSYRVAENVPIEFERQALMHDAAEAFIGDMVYPLKKLIPSFKDIEHNIQKIIFKKYNIEYPISYEVKIVDLRMLATERQQLLQEHDREWPVLMKAEPYPFVLDRMPPDTAAAYFLNVARDLNITD